jgi:hypothetical protein
MSNAAVQAVIPLGKMRLHPIGFVMNSIQSSAESFARSFGATWDGNIFFDPLQTARDLGQNPKEGP